MPLGFGPISDGPVSEGPIFQARFDLDQIVDGQPLIQTVRFFDEALMRRLQSNPEELHLLVRHKLENLVAEIFDGYGYEVDGYGYEVMLTQRTRDGGTDVIAVRRREVDVRLLIQCKRLDRKNPVRIEAVRELYGVKTDDGASKAIIATTTRFTGPAQEFIDKHKWELEGKDFDGIRAWIDDYLRLKNGKLGV
jgi:restriction endonuclease Mrr